ncbi:MAG TPA: glycosyltransferase family 39 protein [Ktedonobacteraceae bacterium]|nr:glycosyltransferase family 39 protein [Ktedonobacteraceae bacterium]
MSTSLNTAHILSKDSRFPDQRTREFAQRWGGLLFWVAVALIIAAAVVMRLYHLDVPFDRDGYDEGVYWQSLRSMLAGDSLYHTIFYSQPPLFLLSTYPAFALFGGSLWSARFSIALISLLGFPGAYLLGKSLAGRVGVLAALLLLLVNPFYLAESQTIQAEASSVAFTFLAIGFAFLWWKQPDGRRGACWAGLCGLTFTASVFCKLLCISTLVPIALLMLARARQIWQRQPGTSRRSWLPLLAGIGAALLTALLSILPFLGSFRDFWAGMITFHQASAVAVSGPQSTMSYNLGLMTPAFRSLLVLAALYGTLISLWRKDWRVLPLLAWLLVTFFLLLIYHPLFDHHVIALEPPLIALAILSVVEPAAYQNFLAGEHLKKYVPAFFSLGILLVLFAVAFNAGQDILYYQQSPLAILNHVGTQAASISQENERVAGDLRRAIAPDQWVITDGQFIAGLADRSTPPSLVDTSNVRITTGYVTLAQLEQAAANPRVHAVLFYTGRFYQHKVAGFHAWVARHFHLLYNYGNGQELWVR